MIELVIFDFDGLLVDSEPIYVNSNKRFLKERGINDFSIINKLFGLRAEEAFLLIKETFSFKESIEELMSIRNKYILEDFENGKLKLMPYVKEVLNKLRKYFKLAIGSSSKKYLLEKGLEIHNLSNYFDVIVTGDDVTKGKPEPDIYLKVAYLMNIQTQKSIVIEDAPNGIIAGKRAGMKTVAIPNEQTKNLDFSFSDFIISDFSKLPSLLGIG
ncbi:MAG: phosphatase [Candidatus Sericytochromatia bacterium]|nr:MAG: phosphatase [Candidatus Sericytochromatia bacterium]